MSHNSQIDLKAADCRPPLGGRRRGRDLAGDRAPTYRLILLVLAMMSCVVPSAVANDGRIKLAAGDFPLTISEPGSYVLVESVEITESVAGAVIVVNADHVSIDLNGHALIWADEHSLVDGIVQSGGVGLRVSNGTLRQFNRAIVAGAVSRVDRLRMSEIRQVVAAGEGSMVRQVQALRIYPETIPVIDLGDACQIADVRLYDIDSEFSLPPVLIQAGEATRAQRLHVSIVGMVDTDGLGLSMAAFGAGSVVDDVEFYQIMHSGSTITAIEMDRGILANSRIQGLDAFAFTSVGVVAQDSLLHRINVHNLIGSAWRGIDVTRSWLGDSRVFSTSPNSAQGIVANSSMVVRNVVDGGYVNVLGTGSLLTHNQVVNSGFQPFQQPAGGRNMAYRNTASTTAGNMISNPHHARVDSYPGTGFILTNNPWGNIRH